LRLPARQTIALVVPSFPRGSETFIVNKFTGLLDRGVDVKIVCGSSDPAEWDRFPHLDRERLVKRVLVNPRASPKWIVPLLFPYVFLRTFLRQPAGVIRYLRAAAPRFGWSLFKRFYLDAHFIAEQPRLIHFEFGTLARDRTYLGEVIDARMLVSFRGYDANFSGLDDPDYYREVWEHADAFHFLGEDLRKRALSRGCPADTPFSLIAPAIDTQRFQPRNPDVLNSLNESRPLRLLSVGRLEWKKGYEYALQAVAELVGQGLAVEYRIVGGGSYSQALGFCRHDLGLDEHVVFLGSVPSEGVREQMHWADILVHAAVSEGFCNAVIEAQAMGLPVVSSNAGGLPENVEDGVTGFVVPRRNPKAMAEKLALLANDLTMRQRMGEAGRVRAVEHFDLRNQTEKFAQLYNELLGG
jgi:colanic acid/amylovoran biosynthesis glycosyltransferase